MGLVPVDASTNPPPPPCEDGPQAMQALIDRLPRLADYAHEFYDTGLPLKALQARIKGEFGSDIAAAFMAAAGGKEVEINEPAELQGELSAKHGCLGQSSWAAPRLAVRCTDIARPGYNSGAA